jgi:hypothetical protein
MVMEVWYITHYNALLQPDRAPVDAEIASSLLGSDAAL